MFSRHSPINPLSPYAIGTIDWLVRPINPTFSVVLNVDIERYKIRHKLWVTIRHDAIPICIVAGIANHLSQAGIRRP